MVEKKKTTKKKKASKKKEVKKEKVCEIYEEKGKTKKSCGDEEIPLIAKNQLKEEDKILRNVFIVIGIFVVLIIGFILFVNYSKNIEYKGVHFEIVKEGKLIFYQTSIPVLYKGNVVPYNFYIRNDPRDLDNIPFEGNITLKKNLVIDMEKDFNCDGDGVIGIANLIKLYEVLGVNVIQNESLKCDEEGKYTYIKIQERAGTGVIQTAKDCYEISVNDCEILPATERLMIETFAEINNILEE